VDKLAIESVHRTKESTTQFHRMLRDRIKHGLQISCRATNNPKNVARGGLLLQRLAKFSRLRGDCSLLRGYRFLLRGYRLLQLRKGLHARCGARLLRAFFGRGGHKTKRPKQRSWSLEKLEV